MIKKAIIAAAALFALSAHAGYAQLAAPAGYASTAAGHTYAAAANDRVYGKVVHQAGALTANVGGQAVKMPAAYRLAANAPRIAAAAIYLHPGIRTAVGVAAWLMTAAVVWDAATSTWRQLEPQQNAYWGSPALPGRRYSSSGEVCIALHGDGTTARAIDANTSQCVHQDGRELGVAYRYGQGTCPAGWTSTPAGCMSPQLQQPQFIDLLNPANQPGWPMPSTVPLELPQPTPLPVEQPFINPAPGENPANRPLRVPTGEPQPIPNTNPQQWRQPYVDIVPAPTPDNPWRVDVKPGETTSTNPDPAENPQPDSQDKPAEEQDKSLCEKHPEIAACEKVEVTDKPLPDQPKLYEPKYPDGITGVWNSKFQEIKATPLFNLAPSLLPNVSAGTCPSWKVDLSIDGWTNAGLQDVSPPCWVWDVAKLVIIASALLLARRLIFGG